MDKRKRRNAVTSSQNLYLGCTLLIITSLPTSTAAQHNNTKEARRRDIGFSNEATRKSVYPQEFLAQVLPISSLCTVQEKHKIWQTKHNLLLSLRWIWSTTTATGFVHHMN